VFCFGGVDEVYTQPRWSAQIWIYLKNLQYCPDIIEMLALAAGNIPAARATLPSYRGNIALFISI